MPDEYSLEKIIPLLESTPHDGGGDSYYKRWKEQLLRGAPVSESDFYKEYYCDTSDELVHAETRISSQIKIEKLATQVKNLTIHYQWEYVGLEDENKIQNSWMLQVFVDKIRDFLTEYRTKTCFQLDAMIKFIEENKFYTHDMERAFEVVMFETRKEYKENPLITGHFHRSDSYTNAVTALRDRMESAFRMPILEMQEDEAPSHRAFAEGYGSVLVRPAAFLAPNVGS